MSAREASQLRGFDDLDQRWPLSNQQHAAACIDNAVSDAQTDTSSCLAPRWFCARFSPDSPDFLGRDDVKTQMQKKLEGISEELRILSFLDETKKDKLLDQLLRHALRNESTIMAIDQISKYSSKLIFVSAFLSILSIYNMGQYFGRTDIIVEYYFYLIAFLLFIVSGDVGVGLPTILNSEHSRWQWMFIQFIGTGANAAAILFTVSYLPYRHNLYGEAYVAGAFAACFFVLGNLILFNLFAATVRLALGPRSFTRPHSQAVMALFAILCLLDKSNQWNRVQHRQKLIDELEFAARGLSRACGGYRGMDYTTARQWVKRREDVAAALRAKKLDVAFSNTETLDGLRHWAVDAFANAVAGNFGQFLPSDHKNVQRTRREDFLSLLRNAAWGVVLGAIPLVPVFAYQKVVANIWPEGALPLTLIVPALVLWMAVSVLIQVDPRIAEKLQLLGDLQDAVPDMKLPKRRS